MTEPLTHEPNLTPGVPAGSPAPSVDEPVIDLREMPPGPGTRVRLARDDNPFLALTPNARRRLMVRILCELVAYDEDLDDEPKTPDTDTTPT